MEQASHSLKEFATELQRDSFRLMGGNHTGENTGDRG